MCITHSGFFLTLVKHAECLSSVGIQFPAENKKCCSEALFPIKNEQALI